MSKRLPLCLLIVSLLLTAFCYFSGLHGYFLFDDSVNIVENEHLRIKSIDVAALKAAAFSGNAGILGRPISMLSFALDYFWHGLNPFYFKLTNLFIHLLNGILIYLLTQLLLVRHIKRNQSHAQTQLEWISLAVASVWLLHPLNLTGVLYVVQRMTSLSALFSLLGLMVYAHGRQRQLNGKQGWLWILSGFAVFTPLAVLCKENGALLPLLMFVVEVFLFRFEVPCKKTQQLLVAMFGSLGVIAVGALLILLLRDPTWFSRGYAIRDFTLPERLMTEARVLWFYIQMTVIPSVSQLGFYHDDIMISRGLMSPPTTLLSLVGLLLAMLLSWFWRKQEPVMAFGVFFFLVGHSLESSVLALELVFEHRNYLPIYGLLITVFYYLLSPLRYPDSLAMRRGLAVGFVLLAAWVTALRSDQWSDPYGLTLTEVAHHPESPRANSNVAFHYAFMPATSQKQAEEYYLLSWKHYLKAYELSSTDTFGLFGLVGLKSRHGIAIDDALEKELILRLEKYPVSAAAGNNLLSLERCRARGICTHTPEFMEALMRAALRNPSLHGRARSNVLIALADFIFVIKHDRESAMRLAYEAADLVPGELGVRLDLIKFLINADQSEEARTQIKLLRELDRMGAFEEPLKELETFLNKSLG